LARAKTLLRSAPRVVPSPPPYPRSPPFLPPFPLLSTPGLLCVFERPRSPTFPLPPESLAARLLHLAAGAQPWVDGCVQGFWTRYSHPAGGGRRSPATSTCMRLPRALRCVLFRDYWEFDLANAHFALANALTGGCFPALRFLVEQRSFCFSEFPGFSSGRPDIVRGIKGFFVTVFNAPSVVIGLMAWKRKHPELAAAFRFTRFLSEFCRDIPDIHMKLHGLFPGITAKARLDKVSASSRILFHCEDACLDLLGQCVQECRGEIGGFLNDGLFVWGPSLPPARAWDLLESVNILLSSKFGGPVYFTLSAPASEPARSDPLARVRDRVPGLPADRDHGGTDT